MFWPNLLSMSGHLLLDSFPLFLLCFLRLSILLLPSTPSWSSSRSSSSSSTPSPCPQARRRCGSQEPFSQAPPVSRWTRERCNIDRDSCFFSIGFCYGRIISGKIIWFIHNQAMRWLVRDASSVTPCIKIIFQAFSLSRSTSALQSSQILQILTNYTNLTNNTNPN